ncbi:MAG: hypothetical protein P9M14_06085 [Candidatus Alcyoniella australis]|nr:hypothetical protein [Candidatus Alcyoniella australis]
MLELEQIIYKLSRFDVGDDVFSKRERMLLEVMRLNGRSVMAHLQLTLRDYRGINKEGQAKIRRLCTALEKICR